MYIQCTCTLYMYIELHLYITICYCNIITKCNFASTKKYKCRYIHCTCITYNVKYCICTILYTMSLVTMPVTVSICTVDQCSTTMNVPNWSEWIKIIIINQWCFFREYIHVHVHVHLVIHVVHTCTCICTMYMYMYENIISYMYMLQYMYNVHFVHCTFVAHPISIVTFSMHTCTTIHM